jgi:hypothetical protein
VHNPEVLEEHMLQMLAELKQAREPGAVMHSALVGWMLDWAAV